MPSRVQKKVYRKKKIEALNCRLGPSLPGSFQLSKATRVDFIAVIFILDIV